MTYITLDYSYIPQITKKNLLDYQNRITKAHQTLHEKNGRGNSFLGWLDLPSNFDQKESLRIQHAAEKIQQQSDILLVIGIGGSYIGARAAIELLNHSFQNQLSKEKRRFPKVLFVGQNLSSTYLQEVLEIIKGENISINVISKSGTTTEPAIAFRIFKEYMEKKYGKTKAKERIFITTDKRKGALKTIAREEGYVSFVIPNNVGGRYSVLTAVGLLPIQVSGISIEKVMKGAQQAYKELSNTNIENNPSYQYAAIRHQLYKSGKLIELLISYEPQFYYFQEWWKQLFGESEGKEGKGIFPVVASFTTDLHSLGQYIQEGKQHLFETTLHVEKIKYDIEIKEDKNNYDELNYLIGKTVNEVNEKAMEGTLRAHKNGGIPNLVIKIPEISSFSFGYLIYFFEKSSAISGYLLGVNPFDQPGVEKYKNNMFSLLGKVT